MMKPKTSNVDARKNISRNFQDARQLLKQRKPYPNTSIVHDARFKIRAKKFQPLKQEMMKIKSSGISKAAAALPGRTITNKAVSGMTNRTAPSEFQHVANTSPVSGFISVKNGKRKLLEKVTMHHTGLKVAVRNELASPPEKRNLTARNQKNEQPLKITLSNPGAIKKQTPTFQAYKLKVSRHDLPVERLRRRCENQHFAFPDHIFPSASGSTSSSFPSNSGYRHMPPAQHISPSNMHPITSKQAMPIPSTSRYETSREHTTGMAPLENYSPLEGTKILVSNLHPVVVEDDILELFSVVGPVRRARMVGMCKAEVVFVKRDDAILAYQKYNNRDLDGQPMIMKLLLHEESSQSKISYSWMNDIGRRKTRQTTEIDPVVLQRSLFKTSGAGLASSPVVFTVKI